MANSSIFLSDLKAGRCSSTVQVQLLLMSLDMLLVDSKATLMQASMNVSRLATYRPYLQPGSNHKLCLKLCVALSRVTTLKGLKILNDTSDSDGAVGVASIVYKEIFKDLRDTKGKQQMQF